MVGPEGCSLEQLVPCDLPWINHGDYVNAVKNVATGWLTAGVINAAQHQSILRQAATSDCGKRP